MYTIRRFIDDLPASARQIAGCGSLRFVAIPHIGCFIAAVFKHSFLDFSLSLLSPNTNLYKMHILLHLTTSTTNQLARDNPESKNKHENLLL